jgi:hypothetical protein
MLPGVAEIVVVVEARTREVYGLGQREQVLIAHLVGWAGRTQVAPRDLKSVEVRVAPAQGLLEELLEQAEGRLPGIRTRRQTGGSTPTSVIWG